MDIAFRRRETPAIEGVGLEVELGGTRVLRGVNLRVNRGQVVALIGPNGSGKSNVVDALVWVMGEQGAKSLRGGKMEDVIFSGTAGRAPLGRAEVALTIDNTEIGRAHV